MITPLPTPQPGSLPLLGCPAFLTPCPRHSLLGPSLLTLVCPACLWSCLPLPLQDPLLPSAPAAKAGRGNTGADNAGIPAAPACSLSIINRLFMSGGDEESEATVEQVRRAGMRQRTFRSVAAEPVSPVVPQLLPS